MWSVNLLSKIWQWGPMCPLLWLRFLVGTPIYYSVRNCHQLCPSDCVLFHFFYISKDIHHFVFLKTHNFPSFGMDMCKSSRCRFLKIVVDVLEEKTNNMHLLYLPLFISTCWLSHVSAAACHHQGAYWILLSYLKNTTEGWYII
jgi:hypothetical protein